MMARIYIDPKDARKPKPEAIREAAREHAQVHGARMFAEWQERERAERAARRAQFWQRVQAWFGWRRP